MNHLLFRAPAYTDRGGMPTYDSFLIFPTNIRGKELIPGVTVDERFIFQFAYFGCINVDLYFDYMGLLGQQHWDLGQQACRMAMVARKSRKWDSNIQI